MWFVSVRVLDPAADLSLSFSPLQRAGDALAYNVKQNNSGCSKFCVGEQKLEMEAFATVSLK